MQPDISRKNQQLVKKDENVSRKGEREGVKYSKKLKKSLLKIKSFLGVLTCSGLQEALIKTKTFCLLYKFKKRYIAIHVNNEKIEIFDPSGFVKTKQTSNLIKFIKAHSTNRKLVFNNNSICSCKSKLACELFLVLRKLTNSFNKTLYNVIFCAKQIK